MGQEERVSLVALGRVTRDHLECPKSHFRINAPLYPVRVALVSRCVRVITITKKTNSYNDSRNDVGFRGL